MLRLESLNQRGVALKKEQIGSFANSAPGTRPPLASSLTCPVVAETWSSPTLLYLAVNCFTGFGWVFDMLNREQVRKRYAIKGDALNDCLVSYVSFVLSSRSTPS